MALSASSFAIAMLGFAPWAAALVAFLAVGLLARRARQTATRQTRLVEKARAEERRRMARDLHDGLAQEVAFIATLGERVEAGQAGEHELRALRRAADRAAGESRVLIDALADPADRPLHGALAQAATEVAERAGADLHIEVDQRSALSHRVREAVLRIVQEGVANAVRHGGARRVDVAVSVNGDVKLSVADDGAGFDAGGPRNGHGFGITSMRQRAAALGGELRIASRPGGGTRLEALLPLDDRA